MPLVTSIGSTLSCQCTRTSLGYGTDVCVYHLRRLGPTSHPYRQLGRQVPTRLVTAVCSVASGLLQVLQRRPGRGLPTSVHWHHFSESCTPAAARDVLDLKPRDRLTTALKELHWLPVAERIQYKLCLLVQQVVAGSHARV